MKQIRTKLLVTAAVTALSGSAFAADMALKQAPRAPMPAAVFSWTGCHVGAHVGWGWGKANFDESQVSSGGTLNTDGTPGSGGVTTSGAVFGGQLGCDYQFSGQWVIGVEGMAAGTDINGTATDPGGINFIGGNTNTVTVKEDFLASVTGRLGYAFNDTLWYVRGGAAWTHDRWNLSNTANSFLYGNTIVGQSRTGWTIGGGVEWAFLPNWTAFVEYDFYDFGSKNLVSNVPFDDTYNLHSGRQNVNVVKVGLNYRF